jgi:tRNA A-37 threonylcarbamoyl transferase component Bud32
MDILRKLEGTLVGIDNITLNSTRLDTLESLLIQEFGPNFEAKFIQRFRSKKNIVVHLLLHSGNQDKSRNLVAKLFVTGYFENELDILSKCHREGLPVPWVLKAENGVILMDYIPGETLTEYVNRTFDSTIIDILAKWYHKFHGITGLVKEDPRLRNFIWNEDILFGLDFEEAHVGHWVIDIGGVSASLLDTDPIFDKRKQRLAWQFLETYLGLCNLKRNQEIDTLFIETIANTLEKTSYWRQDSRIQALAERIRQDGMAVD